MYSVVVNCEKLPFGKTLGASHFLVQLCSALAQECELVFAIQDLDDFESSDVRSVIEACSVDVISFAEASKGSVFRKAGFIELLPHHFQESKLASSSVMICHDLHIFDIGWKYANVEMLRKTFKNNIQKAGAVVTSFPRTYYSLERISGVSKKELFLTEGPLLLDTHPVDKSVVEAISYDNHVIELLYPAQLQKHKNHQMLIEAVAKLKKKGKRVRILCPGSSFNENFTDNLISLVKTNEVEAEIEFMGRIPDEELRQLYWNCDGVIVPSLAEGGAYVALEAIAAGKPVAVNRIDSAFQHIKTVAGKVLWFDSTDIDSTVKVIEQLVEDDRYYRYEVNAIARERINQMTWEKVADKWFAIFSWLSGKTEKPQVYVDADGWNIDLLSPEKQ